ncbi:MAG: TonB-dependent receptor [Gammaproteobacteria bacterium]|nr:TonB-dependent receptor [Gammaproteobacteria bacterium]
MRLTLFFLLTALLAGVTQALEEGRMEEVQVTAGRVEQSTTEVPAAVTVIDSDELERQAPVIAVDLLRGVTGAFVQQTTPGQGIPIIRGLKGSEVLHLVDGMRLNNALFRNAPNQYLALVDPNILERIEAVRGPSPSLYGADAMGGVVQLVSTLPQTGVAPVTSGRLFFDYGSADSVGTTHLSVARSGETAAALVAASYQDVGDRRSGDNTRLTNTSYTARAGRAALRLAAGADHEWLFDLQYLRQPGTPRHDELVAGFGQTEPASAEFSFEPNQRLFAHARYQWRNVSRLIDDLEMHFGLQAMRDDRRTRDLGSTSLRRERNESELLGLSAQLRSAPFGDHRLTSGVEAYFDEVTSSRTATDISDGSVSSIRSRFPDGSTMDNLALYLHDEFTASDRLTLDVGGRYTRVDVSLPPADRGIGAEVSVDDLTANLGAVLVVAPRVSLVANIGRGFRAPNIFDLGTLGPRPGNRFNIANPALGPEEVITVDAGIKFAGSRFIGEAIAWRADYRDKITSVLTGDTDSQGRSVVQSQNAASVDLWGVEAGGRVVSRDGRVEFSGTLNYTYGEEGNGLTQPADRIPPLNGRLGVLWHGDRWWLETAVRFAAEQDRLSDRDIDDPRIDPAGTSGWASADVRAGWDLNERFSAQLRLDNLLDRRYREHGSGIDAPGRSLGIRLEAVF